MIREDSQAEKSAQLLSQANLHRMRREWDEAITSSMQVLYSDPNNWRAHALLGDIYADQNRPDEAIRWYCMTLDIRPESQSTREKLNHVVTSRRREFVESLDPTRPLANRSGRFYRDSLIGKLFWQWSAPERKTRLLAASAVAAIVLVAIAVPVLTARNAQNSGAAVFTPGTVPTTSTLYLQPAASVQSSSGGQTANSGPGPSTQPSNQEPVATTSQSTSVSAMNTAHDANESTLIADLSSDPALSASGIDVLDTEIDPPTNTLSVTYTCDPGLGAITPERILRAGMTVGREALNRPEAASAQTCVVRCLTPSTDQSADTASMTPAVSAAGAPTLAFVATLPRAALTDASSPDKMSDFQIGQAFSSIWWSQSDQPVTAVPAAPAVPAQ